MRERLINRRQQGDLGEASAIEWLTSKGFCVWTPLGHSPDIDLIALLEDRVVSVQVKTTTVSVRTPGGHWRWSVSVATNGGNQSWNRRTKRFDPSKVTYLFVVVGDGRRWFIPAELLEARNAVALAGPKYSEFEIEPGSPLTPLVYAGGSAPSKICDPAGGVSKRSKDGGCKPSGSAFRGSNPLAPIDRIDRPKFEKSRARAGQTILGAKRRLGIPVEPCTAAGLEIGDRMRVRADGRGRVILERIETPPD